MPLSVAQYLRQLATRCSRMSRDCHDPAVAKELEIISVELVEKAEHLEAHFTIPAASADSDDPHPTKIICTDGDEVT